MERKPPQYKPHSTGNCQEKIAAEFLEGHGLHLVESNFHSRFGEIDLILLDGETLVFAEVRFRKSSGFGSALDSITRHKQLRIMKTARFFLTRNRRFQQSNCRFDVIAIDESCDGKISLDWIKSAFME
jgi:putative endonuclease